jgi:PIN domain nuclease of toxin-antitoxin system
MIALLDTLTIIAQALLENMPIVTEDRQIGKYYVETIW